jgi:hypothetical protein
MLQRGLVQLAAANHKDAIDGVRELRLVQKLKTGLQARHNADIVLKRFVSTVKKIT